MILCGHVPQVWNICWMESQHFKQFNVSSLMPGWDRVMNDWSIRKWPGMMYSKLLGSFDVLDMDLKSRQDSLWLRNVWNSSKVKMDGRNMSWTGVWKIWLLLSIFCCDLEHRRHLCVSARTSRCSRGTQYLSLVAEIRSWSPAWRSRWCSRRMMNVSRWALGGNVIWSTASCGTLEICCLPPTRRLCRL